MFHRFSIFALVFLALTSGRAQQPASAPATSLAERLGYSADSRLLIIHADDFGMMHSVNTAIEEAFENHWITSASILVPCPWFPEVVQWTKTHPDADLGIHLALNADWTSYRWSSVSPQPKGSSLLDAHGYLPLLTAEVIAHAKMADVESETHAQIDKAKAAGVRITHIDSHMGTIVSTPDLFKAYLATAQSYRLPPLLIHGAWEQSRDLPPFVRADPIVFDQVLQITPGVPQSQWLDTYKKMLQPLPPGTYQLIVHLAHNDAEMQGATFDHPDWGAQWRQNDLDLVRNLEFQKFLIDQHFILVSWTDLAKSMSPPHP